MKKLNNNIHTDQSIMYYQTVSLDTIIFDQLSHKKRPGTTFLGILAPRTGFEPVTYRLTAGRSTVELSRNDFLLAHLTQAVYQVCAVFVNTFFGFSQFGHTPKKGDHQGTPLL